jgi:hypothetical protein
VYTSLPWPTLCGAVSSLKLSRTRSAKVIQLPLAANAPAMTQTEKPGQDDEVRNAEPEGLVAALVTVGKNDSAETPKSLVVQKGCEGEGCSAGTGIRTTQGPKRKANAKRDLSLYLLEIADESVVRFVPSGPVLYPLAVQSHGNIAATEYWSSRWLFSGRCHDQGFVGDVSRSPPRPSLAGGTGRRRLVGPSEW